MCKRVTLQGERKVQLKIRPKLQNISKWDEVPCKICKAFLMYNLIRKKWLFSDYIADKLNCHFDLMISYYCVWELPQDADMFKK